MTSLSDYKFYNLQEEIDKYTKFEDNLDNISIDNENNKHKVRDDFIDILIKKLKLPELYTKDLEIGVFNATIDYANNYGIQLSWKNQMLIEIYVNISRSIYSNIKKDSYVGNKDLYQRMVKKKEFTPHMLPYMQYQNIFPERWKDIIEKNQRRFKAAYEIKLVAMSDMITCMRCKSKKVSYYELQTRSGDEASTLFMNCLICGKKWKQ
jgi:DNA-directed RNA polymerase subunit M/transcription elongation factor TFIIS|tara:strand:- start:538 stop:1161 length:624 start_codon:yes stop_codon:yes gene_type:complete